MKQIIIGLLLVVGYSQPASAWQFPWQKKTSLDDKLTALQRKQINDPTNPYINYNLGVAAYKKKQFEAAAADFERAIQHAPDKPAFKKQAYCNLGQSYYHQGLDVVGKDWQNRSIEDEVLDKAIALADKSIKQFEAVLVLEKEHPHAQKTKETVTRFMQELLNKKYRDKQQPDQKNPDQQQDNKDQQNNGGQGGDSNQQGGNADKKQGQQSSDQQKSGDKDNQQNNKPDDKDGQQDSKNQKKNSDNKDGQNKDGNKDAGKQAGQKDGQAGADKEQEKQKSAAQTADSTDQDGPDDTMDRVMDAHTQSILNAVEQMEGDAQKRVMARELTEKGSARVAGNQKPW
jgi:hypothetical protein